MNFSFFVLLGTLFILINKFFLWYWQPYVSFTALHPRFFPSQYALVIYT